MLNQVALVGRLTKDVEVRYTSEGHAIATITIAVQRAFKNNDGEYKTDFIRCVLWNKTAENTALYCNKGTVIGITGRLNTRTFLNEQQQKVYLTEVIADSVQFLSFKKHDDEKAISDVQEVSLEDDMYVFEKIESEGILNSYQ